MRWLGPCLRPPRQPETRGMGCTCRYTFLTLGGRAAWRWGDRGRGFGLQAKKLYFYIKWTKNQVSVQGFCDCGSASTSCRFALSGGGISVCNICMMDVFIGNSLAVSRLTWTFFLIACHFHHVELLTFSLPCNGCPRASHSSYLKTFPHPNLALYLQLGFVVIGVSHWLHKSYIS